MSRPDPKRTLSLPFPNGRRSRSRQRLSSLVRQSHIFASLVRQILETKFLQEVAAHPLTLSQFQLLKLIALNGNYQIGEVAGFLGVSPPAATKNIDKLERLGLITRHPSKGDRRATLLSASTKGRRLVEQYESVKAERLTPVFEGFSAKDIDQFTELMERFSLSLLKREELGRGMCLLCSAYCQQECSVSRVRGGCPYERLRHAHSKEGVS
jgi:DNA-binding MarR family transcriptional regulator